MNPYLPGCTCPDCGVTIDVLGDCGCDDYFAHERREQQVVRLAPRDTWPDLRFTLHPLPWCWRLRPRVYADDVDGPKGHCSFRWLFLDVEWWGNKRLFTELVPSS